MQERHARPRRELRSRQSKVRPSPHVAGQHTTLATASGKRALISRTPLPCAQSGLLPRWSPQHHSAIPATRGRRVRSRGRTRFARTAIRLRVTRLSGWLVAIAAQPCGIRRTLRYRSSLCLNASLRSPRSARLAPPHPAPGWAGRGVRKTGRAKPGTAVASKKRGPPPCDKRTTPISAPPRDHRPLPDTARYPQPMSICRWTACLKRHIPPQGIDTVPLLTHHQAHRQNA